MAGGVIEFNTKRRPHKDHSIKVWSQLAMQIDKRRCLNIFHIVSYVKTMSADLVVLVGGWGSSDTILKGDHLRTIPSKFGPN